MDRFLLLFRHAVVVAPGEIDQVAVGDTDRSALTLLSSFQFPVAHSRPNGCTTCYTQQVGGLLGAVFSFLLVHSAFWHAAFWRVPCNRHEGRMGFLNQPGTANENRTEVMLDVCCRICAGSHLTGDSCKVNPDLGSHSKRCAEDRKERR